MTDTANAPERIWAFHAGPMVGLFIGKKEVGTNVAEYVLATHCDELVAAAYLDAGQRIEQCLWSQHWYLDGESVDPEDLSEDITSRTPDDARAARTAYGERMKAEGAREAQAKIARLTEALKEISSQKKTSEFDTEYDVECADFEAGYDTCIDRARAALQENANE